ncbi:MAG: magnesium/cobalt transporter CorA [Thermoleophilaceae bacterium]
MIVDCAVYEGGRRRDGRLPLEQAYEAGRSDDAFVWIGLHEPTEEEFESLTREFGLHELAVEDAIKAHQRPKLEVYEGMVFVVLKTVRWLADERDLEFGEILLFVGRGFVISVRHGEHSELHDVRLALEHRPELLGHGETAVAHAIVDRVVDGYEPVISALEIEVEELEQEVFSASRTNPVEQIYELKRESIELHRAVAPLTGPLDRLARGELAVPDEVRSYFRDVHDHVVRSNERVEALRELLTSVLEANLTQVSVRQNEDVRRISAWVAIIAVPTMIAGVYGMNFDNMPELEWTYGYPLVVGVMAAICLGLYRYFRRAGWL